METKGVPTTCHDCGAEEGQSHEFGCDMERCPFCGSQLISCGCCYKHILNVETDWDLPFHGLPEDIYKDGLSKAQEAEWLINLEEEGRVPWIQYPTICAKCGELWPALFGVPTEEWERYVQIGKRGKVLCQDCYEFVVQAIETAKAERRADDG